MIFCKMRPGRAQNVILHRFLWGIHRGFSAIFGHIFIACVPLTYVKHENSAKSIFRKYTFLVRILALFLVAFKVYLSEIDGFFDSLCYFFNVAEKVHCLRHFGGGPRII